MNRKYEKQYREYVKRITSPKTIGDNYYPDGFEPCDYKRWVKAREAEKYALNKINKTTCVRSKGR